MTRPYVIEVPITREGVRETETLARPYAPPMFTYGERHPYANGWEPITGGRKRSIESLDERDSL